MADTSLVLSVDKPLRLLDLPESLLLEILEQLDYHELHVVAQVSRSFRSATRSLIPKWYLCRCCSAPLFRPQWITTIPSVEAATLAAEAEAAAAKTVKAKRGRPPKRPRASPAVIPPSVGAPSYGGAGAMGASSASAAASSKLAIRMSDGLCVILSLPDAVHRTACAVGPDLPRDQIGSAGLIASCPAPTSSALVLDAAAAGAAMAISTISDIKPNGKAELGSSPAVSSSALTALPIAVSYPSLASPSRRLADRSGSSSTGVSIAALDSDAACSLRIHSAKEHEITDDVLRRSVEWHSASGYKMSCRRCNLFIGQYVTHIGHPRPPSAVSGFAALLMRLLNNAMGGPNLGLDDDPDHDHNHHHHHHHHPEPNPFLAMSNTSEDEPGDAEENGDDSDPDDVAASNPGLTGPSSAQPTSAPQASTTAAPNGNATSQPAGPAGHPAQDVPPLFRSGTAAGTAPMNTSTSNEERDPDGRSELVGAAVSFLGDNPYTLRFEINIPGFHMTSTVPMPRPHGAQSNTGSTAAPSTAALSSSTAPSQSQSSSASTSAAAGVFPPPRSFTIVNASLATLASAAIDAVSGSNAARVAPSAPALASPAAVDTPANAAVSSTRAGKRRRAASEELSNAAGAAASSAAATPASSSSQAEMKTLESKEPLSSGVSAMDLDTVLPAPVSTDASSAILGGAGTGTLRRSTRRRIGPARFASEVASSDERPAVPGSRKRTARSTSSTAGGTVATGPSRAARARAASGSRRSASQDRAAGARAPRGPGRPPKRRRRVDSDSGAQAAHDDDHTCSHHKQAAKQYAQLMTRCLLPFKYCLLAYPDGRPTEKRVMVNCKGCSKHVTFLDQSLFSGGTLMVNPDNGPESAHLINALQPGSFVLKAPHEEQVDDELMMVSDTRCSGCDARLGWRFVTCSDPRSSHQVGRFALVTSAVTGLEPLPAAPAAPQAQHRVMHVIHTVTRRVDPPGAGGAAAGTGAGASPAAASAGPHGGTAAAAGGSHPPAHVPDLDRLAAIPRGGDLLRSVFGFMPFGMGPDDDMDDLDEEEYEEMYPDDF